MKSFAVREKRVAPVARNRSQPSRFGYRGPETTAQQDEIHNILRSTGAQAKLTVGRPNDKYEQEADRVADQVVRMSDTDVAQRVESGTVQPMKIQRVCSECEEEMAQRKPEEEEEDMLLAKEMPGQTQKVTLGLESRINGLKADGQPLDLATRSYFESRFGHDFNHVRVHTDSTSADTAKSIHARAFTMGNHVVMGSGEYQPQSSVGRRLLSHELTHIVQQGDVTAGQSIIQRNGESESERKEEGPGFWGTVGGGLMGEFEEDPSIGMISVDLGVSLIPILDQVSDARDISAHLYFMIAQNQYNRFMRWLGLVFSLIGLFPEVGSAIKSASKYIIKGAREVLSHIGDFLGLIRRFVPEVTDISRLQRYVAMHWNDFVTFGRRAWNIALSYFHSILTRGSGSILSISLRVSGMRARLVAGLARIRELSPMKLNEAFTWARRKWDEVLEQVRERLGIRTRDVDTDIGTRVDDSFVEHPTSATSSQPYSTTPQLARGNLGERLAAEALARDGHQILSYKPSILGTNQGGIDIVTIRNGVVHLIDNKALSRGGNVSSVSALTTNFGRNLTTVQNEITAMLVDTTRSVSERQLLQQALDALNSGNFVRVVTNANITRNTQILSGVTQQLSVQGIRFLDVFP